jgi:hypothetical protein
LSEFEQDLLGQLNKLRRFPHTFIPFLEEHLEHFDDDTLYLPG